MQRAASEAKGILSQFLPVMKQDVTYVPRAIEESRKGDYRALILERSAPLAKLLATGLAGESLVADVACDMEQFARKLDSRPYSLLILDMDVPEIKDMMLLQRLRLRKPETRVLGLGGRNNVEDLVAALDHGADDYLFKPFSLLELMARVRALRRRSDALPERKPQASKLVLHPDQCRVERDGRNIDLTPREFALLDVMIKNAGKTLSRAMLTQEVWNMEAEASTNIVDVYIKYLRDKLDGDHDEKLIRTVRGMGYVLQMA